MSPTSSTTAPPASESIQALMTTTSSSAKAAAPSTQSVSATSTYMIVPPGTSAPNKFYIPCSPSPVGSCYFGQLLPMWLDVKAYGPLYSYEWYPNGNLVSQYLANVPCPSWQKMWFYGDATGWHTLQYYCNGWSNYVYVYVYAYVGSTPTPPPSSCNPKIVVSSPYAKGYSVYVDGSYKGGDGQNGEPEEVLRLLGADSEGRINTSYVERLNLSIRNSLARFVRRGMNCSKDLGIHSKAIDFFQACYNFVKPHKTLRLELRDGDRKWMQRTPAMAEGLTDHIWSQSELLCFRVPVQ